MDDVGDLYYATGLDVNTPNAVLASTVASTVTALQPAGNRSSSVPRVSADVPIWVIPCYSVILLCAVVGNLLVLLTLVQNRRMRTITNVFLLNLAISDILLGVLCVPVTLVGTLLRHFIFGEFLCKFIPFAQAASVAVSSWTLVAISCERYYAICHPLRSRTWQTINHANKIIAFIWMGSIICMTPIAVFSQLMPTSRQGLRKCREQWPTGSLGYERIYNIFLVLALLVFPLLVLSFTYILITRTLYVSMRNERAMIFGSSGPDANSPAVGGATRGSKLRGAAPTGTTAGVSGSAALAVGFASSQQQQQQQSSNQTFRFQLRQSLAGSGSGSGLGSIDSATELEMLFQQQQQQQQAQQQYGAPQYYYETNVPSHGLLGARTYAIRQRNTLLGRNEVKPTGNINHISDNGYSSRLIDLIYRTAMKGTHDRSRQTEFEQRVETARDAIVKAAAAAEAELAAPHHIVTVDDLPPINMAGHVDAAAENFAHSGSKRKLLSSYDGRRQLYCMRSASVKSMRQQQLNAGGGEYCSRAQQQRFLRQQQQLYMTESERRKSLSSPSLRITEATLRRSNETKSLESKKRVVKMLFVLVLEFFICWTPLYVINTLTMFVGPVVYEYVDYTAISFLQLLAYSSSCCNPITYCFMNASFRRAFVDTFKGMRLSDTARCFRRRSKNETNLSVAGNSIALANSVMSANTILESPRL